MCQAWTQYADASIIKFSKMKRYLLCLIAFTFVCTTFLFANQENKALYEITVNRLNIRATPSTQSTVLGVATRGQRWTGTKINSNWIKVTYNGKNGYIYADYTKYIRTLDQTNSSSGRHRRGIDIGIGGWILIIFFGGPFVVGFLQGMFGVLVEIIGSKGIFYIIFNILLLPFRIINWLQRFLHKPWRFFQRYPWCNDKYKPFLRTLNIVLMIPLYVVLTPLRFINAVAFNMFLRVLSEYWNYLCEVINPHSYGEGRGDIFEWLINLPYRTLKYPIYHGFLTIVECAVFTVVDTIYPAVTLYHGTSAEAADSMIISTNRFKDNNSNGWKDGVWNVGDGNYAGDGIYFASAISTSKHYARSRYYPVIIICRVSLGNLLPLSLAPWYVYSQAGHQDAHGITKYGLDNGYTSIEWWRKDAGWWEYCLLDWQNRYNESWRIRPVMTLNLESNFFKRIRGGTRHWLFDSQVLEDLERFIS